MDTPQNDKPQNDAPQNDLTAIRQLLAELTTRVYRIERRLQMESVQAEPVERRPPAAAASMPTAPASRTDQLTDRRTDQPPLTERPTVAPSDKTAATFPPPQISPRLI